MRMLAGMAMGVVLILALAIHSLSHILPLGLLALFLYSFPDKKPKRDESVGWALRGIGEKEVKDDLNKWWTRTN